MTTKDPRLSARPRGSGDHAPPAHADERLRMGSGQPRFHERRILDWGFFPLFDRRSPGR